MSLNLATSGIALQAKRSGPAAELPRIVLRDASGWPIGVPYFG